MLALIEGQINIHEALLYQSEAKNGLHTAKSGLFFETFQGGSYYIHFKRVHAQSSFLVVIGLMVGWQQSVVSLPV